MSKYIGAYKVPEKKIKRWQDIRRKSHVVNDVASDDITFKEADAIEAAYGDISEEIYKLAEADLKKAGFDIRRGDQMTYGFDYLKDDEVMVWMTSGDDDVPDKKSGFGAAT